MQMTYGDTVALFSRMHGVSGAKEVAFRARLKHLQRLGFPPGSNTGTGRRATYDPPKLYLIGVALELLQLGLSPERAVDILLTDPAPLAYAGRFAIRDILVEKGDESIDFQWFLRLDPTNLTAALGGRDEAESTFWYCSSTDIKRMFDEEDGKPVVSLWPRLSLINVSTLINHITGELFHDSETKANEFVVGLQAWFDTHPEAEGGDASDPQA